MSEVKERIIGAVTIMNDEDAAKVWQLIQATFTLANAPVEKPDKEELEALSAYYSGNPEYQPAISQDELIKELDLS